MRFTSFVLAVLLASANLATSAIAGVIVVDPANGPGAHFTSIQAAVSAAASGDVLLLRSGIYQGPVITGSKTLSFVADAGAQVHVVNAGTGGAAGAALQVGALGGGAAFVRGLTFSTPTDGGVPLSVVGSDVPGSHVFIEDCSVTSSGAAGLSLANAGRTLLSRCTIHGSDADVTPGPDGYPISEGQPGALATAGRVAFFGGELRGGAGVDAGLYGPGPVPEALDAMDGAPGLLSLDPNAALKLLSGTLLTGGRGGDGASPAGCLAPGDGGDGVLVLAGSQVKTVALSGNGGAGGIAAPGCGSDGAAGTLLDSAAPGEAPATLPGKPARVFLSRVAREGDTAELSVQDASGHFVVLLIGAAPQFSYLEKFSGVQAVSSSIVLNIGNVPFPGSITYPIVIPELGPGLESLVVYFQPLSIDPQGNKMLGAPSAMLMLNRDILPVPFHGGVFPGEQLPAGRGPRSVAVADFNGDGKPDLVTANDETHDVSVLFGDGLGGAAPNVNYAAGMGARLVAAGDLNGDGAPDVVVGNGLASSLSILLNDGAGHFAPQMFQSTGTVAAALVLGDFDGDGSLDAVTSHTSENVVKLHLGDGAGHLAPPVPYATAAAPTFMTAGDLDGDGDLDLAMMHNGPKVLGSLLNDGAGHFGAPQTFGASYGTGLELADMNEDGKLDLAVANPSNFFFGGAIQIFPGDGAGGFAAPFVLQLIGNYPNSLGVGDMDGDGHLDIVAANNMQESDSEVFLFHGTGNGAVNAPIIYPAPIPSSLMLADMDGMGGPDVITVSDLGDAVSVLLNDGTGALLAHQFIDFAPGNAPIQLALDDFNGDGHLDVVGLPIGNLVAVVLGDGAGHFSPPVNTNVGTTSLDGPATGDVNHDGNVDIVVCHTSPNTVYVAFGTGTGAFAPVVSFDLGAAQPEKLALADLDDDGNLDLVVATRVGSVGSFRVLLGDGAGAFGPPAETALGPVAKSLGVADLDGDGDLDLAFTVANAVLIVPGTGSGSFGAASSWPTGGTGGATAIGDLNGDGDADLVIVNGSADKVSVLLNAGAGAFAAPVQILTPDSSTSVAIADFDADGHADFVVPNQEFSTLSLYVGNGTGSFTLLRQFATGLYPTTLFVGDMDSDGHPDLVVGSFPRVSLLLNRLP